MTLVQDAPRSDALVFFGATGDLAHKQIFPALQALVRDEGLNIPIVGVARAGWNLDKLKERAKDSVEKAGAFEAGAFAKFESLLRYVDGDYEDPATFERLKETLSDCRRPIHYLAVPPVLFASVVTSLSKVGLNENARLVIEKPFGHDRASAQALNEVLLQHFPEKALFRIDHFLGKEAVQNIVYTRFANPMFEPIWNRQYVRAIQITMAESFGIKDRGAFYDATGALKDVVQNHLLQIVAHLMMDPPTGEEREADRDRKAELLKAMRPVAPGDVVRGQYRGYRKVKGVNPRSNVETFVAIKLYVDSWRWAGVPVYIRAGKCLPVTANEVVVEFHAPPRSVFAEPLRGAAYVRMRLSPEVAFAMGLRVKHPGEKMIGDKVELIMTERTDVEMQPYQRLLGDAMKGDNELFGREDIIDAQWRIVQPALDDPTPVEPYVPGTWGPESASSLIGGDGPWRDPVTHSAENDADE